MLTISAPLIHKGDKKREYIFFDNLSNLNLNLKTNRISKLDDEHKSKIKTRMVQGNAIFEKIMLDLMLILQNMSSNQVMFFVFGKSDPLPSHCDRCSPYMICDAAYYMLKIIPKLTEKRRKTI